MSIETDNVTIIDKYMLHFGVWLHVVLAIQSCYEDFLHALF